MEKKFNHFLEVCQKLNSAAQDFCVVTLVNARGSIPQDIGAKMIVSENKVRFGTVGGGKVEAKAIQNSMQLLLNDKFHGTDFVTWNLQKDVGMTCGGEVQLFFEAIKIQSPWQITIFGAGHVSQELSRILCRMNCDLTVIDHRKEWLEKLPHNIKAIYLEDPKSYVSNIRNDSFVILMTMGHSTDLPILAEILKLQRTFPYLGVIGSKAKRVALLNGLENLSVSEHKKDQFICPIGEPIGTNSPVEIAISISAQLLKVRDNI